MDFKAMLYKGILQRCMVITDLMLYSYSLPE